MNAPDQAKRQTLALDPLIGRDPDVERVRTALARTRLVTITGPGGTGKTRLAAAIIEQLQRVSEAWFVDLTAVSGADLVAPAIVSALGLRGASLEPAEIVTGALRGRAVVLALDNVEQIPDVGPLVDGWLRELPELRALLTSRIPVGVAGEIEVHLDTLSVPEADDVSSVESAPASALFLRRARSVGRLDVLNPAAASAVAALVRRLDGLPLAIELAAARTRIMSPAEILSRFDREGPAAVDRPGAEAKSLRSIFDWTYSLLETDQRTALAAVALCPSFDLALAEALVPELDVARALDALVALSLVREAPSRAGATRFRVFESVRQELARRTSPSERETFLARHATAVLETAAGLARAIDEASPRWAFDRLEDEADNARLALDTLQAIDRSKGVRLWRELRHLWHRPVRVREGLTWLAQLEAGGDLRDEDLCAALTEALELVEQGSGHGSGLELLERALGIAERVNDVESQMALLTERTRIHVHNLDEQAAESDAVRIADLAAANPSDRATFFTCDARMFVASMRPRIDVEAMAAAKAAHLSAIDGAPLGTRLLKEGAVAMFQVYGHEYAEALASIDRVLSLRLDTGPNGVFLEQSDVIWFFHIRTEALAGLGRLHEAAAQIIEAVELCPAEPPLQDVVVTLGSAQLVIAAQGKLELAARLFGWLDHGGRFDPHDRKAAVSTMRMVRRQLGETATELAIRDGAAADPVQLLRSLPVWLADNATTATRETLRHGDLTRREVEIVMLVAQGKSNQEIADALFISPKTASVHVGNIREKLGAHTRLEVALRAREMGLANVARTAFD
jgi:predicted ATPase/DNA-binding CsgD family transcriptional regulator